LAAGRSPGLTPYDEPVFCVCTHGKHDACCAELGRPLCRAMHAAAPEQTWEVSHIGGDRFAPNMLVLPHGLYYGRLPLERSTELVEAHACGELLLEHLRGRSGYPMPVQAAEIALRRHLRIRTVEALPVGSTDREGDEWTVVFTVDEVDWRVRVRSTRGAPHQLTCRAVRENPALEHILLGIEQVG
jgi:Sucrase/ferredoxin-like